jgi:Pyruvate/2-oxoacid:ferredoxin oxidoreductase delta subunit
MKKQEAIDQLNRREFLRRFPRQLLKKFSVIAREGIFAFSSDGGETVSPQNFVAQVEVLRCHAWGGLICQQCYLACPKRDRAIEMRDQKPIIITSICDGCAMCVSACETVNDLPAVQMVSRVSAPIDFAVEKEVVS